jgi:biopolymer transport protein ExbD
VAKLTPIEKRAERKARNQTGLDMNLVALIDIFTILIFFLLSSAAGVEILGSSKAVKLPESVSQKTPVETVVVTVTKTEIVVDGRLVASVDDALKTEDDLIAPLKAELDLLQANRKVLRADNEALAKAVTIMGDKDIPYRLLRKVMYTAAQANYGNVSFAVNRKLLS